MRDLDVLIVGSGPSGMSTALHLVRSNPGWSRRVLVVDAAVHPRHKLCGGAVTRFGSDMLTNLGLTFDPPHIAAHEICVRFESSALSVRESTPLRITRRDVFDHWLVQRGTDRGIEVRQGEAVLDVVAHADHVDVATERGVYRAKVVVAADGASSTVKRRLKWGGRLRRARLLEVLTPEIAADRGAFEDGVAVFDFTPMMRGVQGYYWDFPSRIDGSPFMNRGVFDSRVRPEMPLADLKAALADQLDQRGIALADVPLEGHPLHWYDAAATIARPRVLLVGDAAGADPLLGEGIAFALGYGEVAAAAIVSAFDNGRFDFADYPERVRRHRVLRRLRWRAAGARILYALPKHPWSVRFAWALTCTIVRSVRMARRGARGRVAA